MTNGELERRLREVESHVESFGNTRSLYIEQQQRNWTEMVKEVGELKAVIAAHEVRIVRNEEMNAVQEAVSLRTRRIFTVVVTLLGLVFTAVTIVVNNT